jgi:hypothetical protein
MAVPAQLDVVEHREAPKQCDVLEAASQPESGTLGRGETGDVSVVENDLSRQGAVKARDGVEDRRLACTIGTDDRGDRALANLESNRAERLHPAECQRDVLDLQQGAGISQGLLLSNVVNLK